MEGQRGAICPYSMVANTPSLTEAFDPPSIHP